MRQQSSTYLITVSMVAFAQALTDGVSVFDLSDTTAQNEILNIINELEAARWL